MKLVRGALALFVLLSLTAPAAVRAADPYEIHALIEQTGTAGFVGKNEVIALQALENRTNAAGGINGRPIKFVIHDTASNPQVAVQLTNELISKNVPMFLGASLSATCSAEMPLLKNGPTAFCLSNAIYPEAGSFIFAASVTTQNHVSAGMRYLRLKGAKRVGAIVTTDTSGQNGEAAIRNALNADENKGMTLVGLEHFNPTDLTVNAQLARIKAANPDLIVIWCTGVPAGTVLRGLNETGLSNVPVLISPGNATFAQMQQYAQFLPKDLYFTLPAAMLPNGVADATTKRMIKEVHDVMTPLGGQVDISVTATWDASLLALSAIRKLGFNPTADQVRAYVASVKGFDGIAGRYDFTKVPQRGIGEESEYIGRWDASKNNWIGVSKAGGAPL